MAEAGHLPPESDWDPVNLIFMMPLEEVLDVFRRNDWTIQHGTSGGIVAGIRACSDHDSFAAIGTRSSWRISVAQACDAPPLGGLHRLHLRLFEVGADSQGQWWTVAAAHEDVVEKPGGSFELKHSVSSWESPEIEIANLFDPVRATLEEVDLGNQVGGLWRGLPNNGKVPVIAPSKQTYALSINGSHVTGPSFAIPNGTVNVSPAPNAPSNQYTHDTVVTFVLDAASGYTGTCSPSSVTMTSAQNVTCSVSQQTYALSINGTQVTGSSFAIPNATVSVTPAPNAPGNQYTHGTVVTFALDPASDYTGVCSPSPVTMTTNQNVTCSVSQQTYAYTLANPSFELGTDSPQGWTWPSPELTGLTWDDQMAHSGQRSIRWSAPILFSSEYGCLYGMPPEYGVESAPVRIDLATTYKISVWGKGSIAGSWISSLTASVKVFDGTGEEIPVQWPGFGVHRSEEWSIVSTTIGPDGDRPWPDGAMLVTVNLTNGFEAYRQPASCNNEVLDVWADSVSLEPI